MTLLATTSELHAAWAGILATLRRDPFLTSRFAEAPIATLNELGFELSQTVQQTLRAALP